MKIYLVVQPDPCFDCSTEDIVAICTDPQKAKDIANTGDFEIREHDLDNVIITTSYLRPALDKYKESKTHGRSETTST